MVQAIRKGLKAMRSVESKNPVGSGRRRGDDVPPPLSGGLGNREGTERNSKWPWHFVRRGGGGRMCTHFQGSYFSLYFVSHVDKEH